MNVGSRIHSFRIYHRKQPSEVADSLKISVNEYQSLEFGRTKVKLRIAEKLSEVYQVPVEIFTSKRKKKKKVFKFQDSPFNSSNGYVHNLYQQDIRLVNLINESKDDIIQVLIEEIRRLRVQNQLLIEKLL